MEYLDYQRSLIKKLILNDVDVIRKGRDNNIVNYRYAVQMALEIARQNGIDLNEGFTHQYTWSDDSVDSISLGAFVYYEPESLGFQTVTKDHNQDTSFPSPLSNALRAIAQEVLGEALRPPAFEKTVTSEFMIQEVQAYLSDIEAGDKALELSNGNRYSRWNSNNQFYLDQQNSSLNAQWISLLENVEQPLAAPELREALHGLLAKQLMVNIEDISEAGRARFICLFAPVFVNFDFSLLKTEGRGYNVDKYTPHLLKRLLKEYFKDNLQSLIEYCNSEDIPEVYFGQVLNGVDIEASDLAELLITNMQSGEVATQVMLERHLNRCGQQEDITSLLRHINSRKNLNPEMLDELMLYSIDKLTDSIDIEYSYSNEGWGRSSNNEHFRSMRSYLEGIIDRRMNWLQPCTLEWGEGHCLGEMFAKLLGKLNDTNCCLFQKRGNVATLLAIAESEPALLDSEVFCQGLSRCFSHWYRRQDLNRTDVQIACDFFEVAKVKQEQGHCLANDRGMLTTGIETLLTPLNPIPKDVKKLYTTLLQLDVDPVNDRFTFAVKGDDGEVICSLLDVLGMHMESIKEKIDTHFYDKDDQKKFDALASLIEKETKRLSSNKSRKWDKVRSFADASL